MEIKELDFSFVGPMKVENQLKEHSQGLSHYYKHSMASKLENLDARCVLQRDKVTTITNGSTS